MLVYHNYWLYQHLNALKKRGAERRNRYVKLKVVNSRRQWDKDWSPTRIGEAEWNKQSPSPVALQARNPLVSSAKIMSSRISVWPISSLSIISGFSVDSFCFIQRETWLYLLGEIYNSFVFPRWNPGQAVSSEILNQFVGRTVTSKNPFLPSNSNWKSNKQSTHTRPLTQFSLTRCFPAQMDWSGLVC